MSRTRWYVLAMIGGIACFLLAMTGALVYSAALGYSAALPTQADRPSPNASVATVVTTPAATPSAPGLYVTLAPLPPLTHTPTPLLSESVSTYTVAEGDTLWDIAARFNINIDTLIAANPTLNPDVLAPGEVVNLVLPSSTAPPQATVQPPNAQVAVNGGGLRLRKGPGLSQNILTLLDAGTPLTLIGRTDSDDWLQVIVPAGDSGWVMARYVQSDLALDTLPVTGEVVTAPTGVPPQLGTLPTPPGEAVAYPYITNLTQHSRDLFAFGLSLGNRPDVFSKVGDSITVSDLFLKPFGVSGYNLRDYGNLQPVIDYYSHSTARSLNSFAETTLAAKVGWPARAVLDPEAANTDYCWEGEAPLVCEYRYSKPSVALIMLGTNDVPNTPLDTYERDLRQVIEISMELGVVPVMSTIPEMHRDGIEGRVAALNEIITRLAHEYDIPLWDYHAALVGLPNDGLFRDGVHPSIAPNNADFTPENLQFGYTVRNLTALQALDAVWRFLLK